MAEKNLKNNVIHKIKKVISYKKPALWITIVAVLITVLLLTILIPNPASSKKEENIKISPTIDTTQIPTTIPTITPEPTRTANQKVQEKYPGIDDLFAYDNSNAKKNELLRSYKVINNQIYFIFSKDDITLSYSDKGDGGYTLQAGDRKATYHWPITYYPGSKAWLTAELIDVTNDGVKDLCTSIYLGSGTGVCVSGMFIVDLSNMKEIKLLDKDNYSLRVSDAKKINNLLLREKKNYDYLDWVTNKPVRKWNVMSFGLTSSGKIQIDLGISKENWINDYVGNAIGTYVYRNGDFVLNQVRYEPSYIKIKDGYKPVLKDVVDCYGNESATSSEYEQISKSEVKRILSIAPFGEGSIIIFEGFDYKLYSGYEKNNHYYLMDTLDDPHNYNIEKDENSLDNFVNDLVSQKSITNFKNILHKSGVVLTVGYDTESTTYYFYDKEKKRPVKLIALNRTWEALNVVGDETNEFISLDYDGNYKPYLILDTKDGIKMLDFSLYRLIYDKEKKYFIRNEDNEKFKFNGSKFTKVK